MKKQDFIEEKVKEFEERWNNNRFETEDGKTIIAIKISDFLRQALSEMAEEARKGRKAIGKNKRYWYNRGYEEGLLMKKQIEGKK